MLTHRLLPGPICGLLAATVLARDTVDHAAAITRDLQRRIH
ncbi:hypothetical protein ACQEVC_23520 [Plantactinospora sp. CA-294935]